MPQMNPHMWWKASMLTNLMIVTPMKNKLPHTTNKCKYFTPKKTNWTW